MSFVREGALFFCARVATRLEVPSDGEIPKDDGEDEPGGRGSGSSPHGGSASATGNGTVGGGASSQRTDDHGCVGQALEATKPGGESDGKDVSQKEGRQLTDPKGLGKLRLFRRDEAEFVMWSRKTENYILRLHTESGDLMRMVAEEPNSINLTIMKADPSTPYDETVDEINVQAYPALMAVTSNAGKGAGLEACRGLNRRHDRGAAG